MFVKDCMSKNVVLGSPSMSLQEAALKMRDGDFGILPIAENERLVGMVTDRDLAVRAVAEGKNPRETQAREVMSKSVLYCFEDQNVEEVLTNLGDKKIRRLPVLNRQKRLVGILSLGDLARKDVSSEKFEQTLGVICSKSKSPEARVSMN